MATPNFFTEDTRDYHMAMQVYHKEKAKQHKALANVIDLKLYIKEVGEKSFLPIAHTYGEFSWNGRFSLLTGVIHCDNDGKFYKSPSGFATAHIKSLIAIGLYTGDAKVYKGTNGWTEVKIIMGNGRKIRLDTYRLLKKIDEN